MKALLLIVTAVILALVVITIVVGSSTFEGLVVGDPYETGLKWDAIQRQRRESGWTVALLTRHVHAGKNDLVIQATGRDGGILRNASISLKLERPATSSWDRQSMAVLQKDGRFHASVELPLSGRWTVEIGVSNKGKTIVFEDALFAD